MPARRLPDHFERLAAEWDALADQTGASPFARPGWVGAWWRAFGAGNLELLTHRDESGLRGVLPINFRHGLALSPCNWHSPEFGVVYADGGSGVALLEALFSRRPQAISLRLLDARDALVERLRAAAAEAHYHRVVSTLAQCPVALLGEGWDTYERGRSRNLKGDLRRCRRRLSEHGPVSLEVSRSATELESAFALEQLGWKGARKSAMASRQHTAQFYVEIAHWAQQLGWLRLVFLRAGNRRVAFHFALEHGGAYIPLKGGFDPAVRECSPGKLIIHATLKRAFDIGLRRYEFLAGGEDYKLRWATGTTDRVHFRAFAPTLRGVAARAVDLRGRQPARRALAAARAVRAG
jgi:CelD/BcsL family acetyltransferase involved in cellulose biosynthesis